MQKRIILGLITLLCPVFLSIASTDEGCRIRIELEDTPPKSSVHRIPAKKALECYYDSGLCCIIVELCSSVGEVMVDVDNISTGEHIDALIPSNVAYHILSCPGDEGCCIVTFTLSNGRIYSGTFNLQE